MAITLWPVQSVQNKINLFEMKTVCLLYGGLLAGKAFQNLDLSVLGTEIQNKVLRVEMYPARIKVLLKDRLKNKRGS